LNDAPCGPGPTEEPELVRVVLVDDHPLFLDGMRSMIGRLDWAEVVGDATTAAEAVTRTVELEPDVVVMDLQMPHGSGVDATRQISAALPNTAVLVLTMFDDDDSVFAAMRAGARGYLLKGASRDEVVRALASVANGEAVFGPGIARRLLRYFAELGEGRSRAPLPALTGRERQILDLMASGKRNADIATALYLSPKTVRNNISNIFVKLHVADRAAAIVRGRQAGLGREADR
jgi:DNA-binding NarL/FixJ family response regulator